MISYRSRRETPRAEDYDLLTTYETRNEINENNEENNEANLETNQLELDEEEEE